MTNTQKRGAIAPDELPKNEKKESAVTELPKTEMYMVLGLELGQKMFEKLEMIEGSIEVLAMQKARELEPEPPKPEAEK